jgi:hypothetical protein
MRALQDDVYKYMQMQKQQGAEYSSGMQQQQTAELQPPPANNYGHATYARTLQQQAQKKDIKKNDGSAMPLWVQGLTEIGSIGVGKRTVFLVRFCARRGLTFLASLCVQEQKYLQKLGCDSYYLLHAMYTIETLSFCR